MSSIDSDMPTPLADSHLLNLRSMLAEVGPDVSAALTQLALARPEGASKQEALAFLVQHLSKVGRKGSEGLPPAAAAFSLQDQSRHTVCPAG